MVFNPSKKGRFSELSPPKLTFSQVSHTYILLSCKGTILEGPFKPDAKGATSK